VTAPRPSGRRPQRPLLSSERVAPDAGRWPNLFIVGAAKAGTTTLWRRLGSHPDIYMSPVKEPGFFAPSETMEFKMIRDEDEYLRLFGGRDERYLGEATPSYLWDPYAPPAIKSRSRDAHILISLRDPVDRAFSAYAHAARATERRSFLEVIDAELAAPETTPSYCVGRSFYADSVARYLEEFGDGVHIVFFEDFVRDDRPVLRGVLEFLEVDPEVEIGSGAEASNPRAAPRNRAVGRLLGSRFARGVARNLVPLALQPRIEEWLLKPAPNAEIEPEARRILSTLFAPDVDRLRSLVDRPIPW
jgi:hypothetical protein